MFVHWAARKSLSSCYIWQCDSIIPILIGKIPFINYFIINRFFCSRYNRILHYNQMPHPPTHLQTICVIDTAYNVYGFIELEIYYDKWTIVRIMSCWYNIIENSIEAEYFSISFICFFCRMLCLSQPVCLSHLLPYRFFLQCVTFCVFDVICTFCEFISYPDVNDCSTTPVICVWCMWACVVLYAIR